MIRKKILIIEDEEDISRPLAFRFEKAGFDVTTTADGQQGLELAKHNKPDLIILDLTLPSMSGEEICKLLREDFNEQIANIPIVMLTAKTSDVDKIIGKVIGANAYVTKPFQAEKLMDEVHQLVGVSA